MASMLCQKWFLKKTSFFCKKLKILCSLDHTILFANIFKGMFGETLDFQCQHNWATVAGKSFNGKFTAKIDFPIRYFYVTIANADIGSQKSLHTLFDKYLDPLLVKFEQSCMVQTIQNFELFDKKWFTIFDKALTPLWNMFLWLKQLLDAKLLI